MGTPAQIEASRRNGACSRGPVTPEGKAVSSRNAIRHGLFSRSVVLADEDPSAFDLSLQDFIHRYQPADNVELALVEEMAAASWRLRRAITLEARVLNAGLGLAAEPAPPLVSQGNAFELVQRYHMRMERSYQRALNCLLKLRKEVPLPAPEPAPEPAILESKNEPEPVPPPPKPPVKSRFDDDCQYIVLADDRLLKAIRAPSRQLHTSLTRAPGQSG